MTKIINLLKLVRPHQWLKNTFVFIPFLFAGELFDIPLLFKVFVVFVAFCLASGSIYILNDLSDLTFDRKHPEKKNRPLAAGTVSIPSALIIMSLSSIAAIYAGFWYSREVGFVVVSFIFLNIFYSLYFKNVILLDIFCIALGFLLRVAAGVFASTVPPSNWIIIMTLALALLLGVGKRKADLLSLNNADLKSHRKALNSYSVYTIDQMIVILASMIIITFSLYTMSDYAIQRFGTDAMIFTVPLVIYGLFRYIYIVNDKGSSGDPTKILFTDRPMLFCVILWVAACAWIIYK